MPLSERARIEVYVPEISSSVYVELIESLEREFSHTFGGSSTIRGIDGNYLSNIGIQVGDKIALSTRTSR